MCGIIYLGVKMRVFRDFAVFTGVCVLLSAPALAADVASYCVVEVGSKGIKARVFEFTRINDGEAPDVKQKYSRDINTNLVQSMKDGRFTDVAILESTDAIAMLVGDMKEQSGAKDDCLVVGSSGAAKALNTDELAASVANKTGILMDFINPEQEAKYAMVAAIRPKRRPESVLVDIGSGNTKVGYQIPAEKRFVSFEIPYGSVSLKKAALEKGDFSSGLASVLDGEISPAYKQQLEDKPSLANRARIYWVGGAAWATTSYTHPERATNRFAFLTRKDVRKFLEALKKDKWLDWTPPSGLDPKTAEKAIAEYQKVKDTFARDDLIAGVSIINAVLEQSKPSTMLVFPRNGQWIYGYTMEKYKQDY
jgi:exopolyphosphatase/pppGpp-phosphohydrolase